MNPIRITLFILLFTALLGLSILSGGAASASAYALHPQSMVSGACCASGTVSAMWVLDQSGTQDAPAKYVAFTTPGHSYSGFRRYYLPATILRSTVSALRVKVNYKGPAAAAQVWAWYAWNWNTSAWAKIGTNATAKAGTWTVMTFALRGALPYINATSREIRIRLASNNDVGNAKLDYEAVLVSYANTPTPRPTLGPSPDITACTLFPADNVWNTPIASLPVHVRSTAWISSIGATSPAFHMDFGSGLWDGGAIGIPYNVVDGTQVTKYTIQFTYADESDSGPYPLPASPAREWGSDHHILVVDTSNCYLYELYAAFYSSGKWLAGSGASWNLGSDALRPAGWTSADAAGLPILPGLVRYQELAAALMQADPAQQVIRHALRFTASSTNSYIWPARHLTAGSPGVLTNVPPMGARFRLKAAYDISGFSPQLQVILRTMKTYGIILADNGTSWMVSGAPDQRWNNDVLHGLDVLKGTDFVAVDESCLMVSGNSAQADPGRCP